MKDQNKKQNSIETNLKNEIKNKNIWAKDKINVSMEDPSMDKNSIGGAKAEWD